MARPAPLGRFFQGRIETEHVESAVAIVAKQQLVVVLRRRAKGTRFALYTLPLVPLRRDDHVVGELKACWMTGSAAFGARDHGFWTICLLVLLLVTQAKVAVFCQGGGRNLRGGFPGSERRRRRRCGRHRLHGALGEFWRDIGEGGRLVGVLSRDGLG